MSQITIASLPRLTPSRLHALLEAGDKSIAVVDVRDSDYIGGHIRNCIHVPSSNLDWKLPELIRTLKEKDIVIFHCMLSQQRGPAAGLRYLRERQHVQGKEDITKEQNVYVLEGGFQKWQELYGEDESLTEGWIKDLWE